MTYLVVAVLLIVNLSTTALAVGIDEQPQDDNINAPTGVPVETGVPGETGDPVETGDPGETGDPVETGVPGETGDPVETGEPGETGDPGEGGQEQGAEALLTANIRQTVFQEDLGNGVEAFIRYTIKVQNIGNGDSMDTAVSLQLSGNVAHDPRADETQGLLSSQPAQHANAGGAEISWANQVIAAGGENTYLVYGKVLGQNLTAADVEGSLYVDGTPITDPSASIFEGEELLALAPLLSTYTFEDDEKKITVTLCDPSVLPQGAQFVVENLSQQELDAYKALVMAQLFAGDEAQGEPPTVQLVLYDAYFTLNGEEVPLGGTTVSITIENKMPMGVDAMAAEDTTFEAIHIKQTENGETVEKVTTSVTRAENGAVESVQMETDGFSPIGFISYATDAAQSTDTLIGEHEDAYTIDFILKNYNVFVKERASAGHTVGAVAVGGDSEFNQGIGQDGYEHPVSSYLAGETVSLLDYIEGNSQDHVLFVGDGVIRGEEKIFIRNQIFIDFEEAFSKLSAEAQSYKDSGDVNITQALLDEARANKTATDEGRYIITYQADGWWWETDYRFTAYDGYSYEFGPGVLSQIGMIDLMYDTDDFSDVSATFISADEKITSLPFVYHNDTSIGLGNHGTGCGVVFMLPDAQSITLTNNQPRVGHVVAPNAVVTWGDPYNSNSNGCWLVRSLSAAAIENHMWPYTGDNDPKCKVIFKGAKTLNGRYFEESDSFTIELYKGKMTGDTVEYDENPLQRVTISGKTGSDAQDYAFNAISYSKPDTHYYKIKEVKGDADGITYSTKEYTIEVVVDDNLVPTVTVDKVAKTFVHSGDNYSLDKFDFENKATPHCKVTFSGLKTLNGRSFKEDDKFTIQLFVGHNTDGTLLQEKDVTIEGTYSFEPIEYTETGTYYYKIKEMEGSADGITYSTVEYLVTVTVSSGGDSGLTATVTDKHGSFDTTACNFINTYDGTEVIFKGAKTLNGRDFKESDRFTFQLYEGKITGGTVVYEGELVEPKRPLRSFTISGKTGSGAQDYAFDAIEYTETGIYYYKIKEMEGSADGITYSTVEYLVTVTVVEEDGKLIASVTGKNGSFDTAKCDFINTYDGTDPKCEVIFKGAKTLNGRDFKESDRFTFQLYEGKMKDDTVVYEGESQVPKDPLRSFTISGKTGSGAQDYAFDAIEYTETGIYYYKVNEENHGETIDGVEYSRTEHEIVVEVKSDGDGKLVPTVTVNGKSKTVSDESGVYTLGGFNFENTYKGGTDPECEVIFGGTKTLSGRAGKTGDVFTIQLFEGGSKEALQKATVTIDPGKYTKPYSFAAIKYTTVGKRTYTIVENQENTISGITYSTVKYVITVDVTKGDDGKLTASITRGDAAFAPDKCDFTNKYTTPYDPYGSLILGGSKHLKGRSFRDTDRFTLNLYYGIKESGGVTYSTNPMDSQTVGGGAGGNAQDFAFNKIEYSSRGTYYYKVEEKYGGSTIDGVVYSNKEYHIVVYVTDDGNGNLIPTVTVNGQAKGANEVNNTFRLYGLDFTNISTTTPGGSPQTGDRASLAGFILMFLATLTSIALIFLCKKKLQQTTK